MKFLVLPRIFHEGEIHCLDVNRDSTGLVTGGKDNGINVWNLQELIEISKLEEKEQPNLKSRIENVAPIHTISGHPSTVSMLRWLPHADNMFVSASQDGTLYFHELRDENKSRHRQIYPFDAKTTENLKPIVDMSVSRDGRLVAWSTLDEKVCVYDVANDTFQELAIPSSEKPVIQRSLAFNNTSNYLVSIGDDTQINVFQYEYTSGCELYKFRLINKIAKLFNENPLNVKYKRISWSPDGELVSIPTANKGQTSLISLLSAQTWNTRESLVGHDLTCEVVRFSPHLYSELDQEMNNLYSIVASGGSDRSFALWNTSKTSPVLVLRDVVDAQIYDMAWTGTENLIFSTSRGNLGVLSFDTNELGYKVSSKTVQELQKIQQDSVKPMTYRYEYDQSSGNRKTIAPIEYTDQKQATNTRAKDQNKNEASAEKQANPKEQAENKKQSASAVAIIKTDIIPEVISATPPAIETGSKSMARSTSSTEMATTITTTPQQSKATTIPSEASTSMTELIKPSAAIDTPKVPDMSKQKVTTKNGKRRIKPMLISSQSIAPSATAVAASTTTTTTSQMASFEPQSLASARSLMEYEKPSYLVSEEFSKSLKARNADENGSTGAPPSAKRPKREMEPVKFIGSVIMNPNTSFSKIRLSTPKIRFGFQLQSEKDQDCLFVLDIKNGSGNESKPSRITYFKKDKEIWCDFIPKFIHLACEGTQFWCVATVDGQIFTYSRISGRKIWPPLILGSPVSFLESHGDYLMAVTSLGELYVWNIAHKKAEISCSISSLLELGTKFQEDGLSKSDNITMCAITSRGIPLVTLSNGSGYLYNQNLEVWQVITESWWAFGSYYWDGVEDGGKQLQTLNMFNSEDSILELLEHKTNEEILRKTRTGRGKYFNKISKNMIMKEGFESLENTISISHLENRILACELLGEEADFHKNFKIYVQRICELGFKAKLFEVCDELLGPIDQKEKKTDDVSDGSRWDPKILGFDKRQLLEEVITLCSQFRDAQRVLYHFSKKIGLVGEGDEGINDGLV
ncbi:uncharacterized protein LODBEIA_P55480 [Lodderomyces beijingensis]|uniref:Protein HIR n=1 Tax=Lodderomyces beijingensis TaxID=1775926 RepID=A0ABP0ZT57_9ASCO